MNYSGTRACESRGLRAGNVLSILFEYGQRARITPNVKKYNRLMFVLEPIVNPSYRYGKKAKRTTGQGLSEI